MGLCTRRHFVLTICILQLISTVERQVFDFLGTMWGPILANFFQIIFVIFGFFGTHQFRPKYIIAYLVWSIIWIGWNIFIVCFYLNVGILNKDEEYNLLNFQTGAVSWWEVNGFGCRPSYATNFSNEDISHPPRPESVSGCILNYEYVEVLHAAIQVILAILGGCGAVHFLRVLVDEDDSSSNKKSGAAVRPASLYSIEYTPHPHEPDRIDDRMDDQYTEEDEESMDGNLRSHASLPGTARLPGPQLSPRPMTPRRVKRRSVNSRGTSSALGGSGTLRGATSHSQHPPTLHRRQGSSGMSARSSLRSSGRKSRSQPQHQNPVTRLLIQQQQQQLHPPYPSHIPPQLPPQLPPPLPQQLPPSHSMMRLGQTFSGPGDSTTSNESRPGFVESSSHTDLLISQENPVSAMVSGNNNWRKTGHVNPLYQQSSNQSLAHHDDDDDDDSYNRPPSARSSYSNYHGARALGHLSPSNNYGQATAQVPVVNSYRRSQNTARQSLRNAAFLNSGPPAYRSQGNLDSETVI